MSNIEKWLKSGEHLPRIMRDFHDQKDLFKAMHETVDVRGHEYAGKVDWVTGQCYVIDVFLWFMARRGYTLQRSRARQDFWSLEETIDMCNRRRLDSLKHWMNGPSSVASKEEPQ